MIRPGIKFDDANLLKADLDDLFVAKNLLEWSAFMIAKVVQCAPLDKDLESFKKLGCDTMELARKISAARHAHEEKWNKGVSFKKAYRNALSLDTSAEDKFYKEVMPRAKHTLKKYRRTAMFNSEEK